MALSDDQLAEVRRLQAEVTHARRAERTALARTLRKELASATGAADSPLRVWRVIEAMESGDSDEKAGE